SISEIRSSFVTVFFILVSEIGTWCAIFFAIFWSLLAKKRHLTFLFSLVISLLGAQFLYFALKDLFNRPRPSFPHLIHYSGYSFPSGHSTIAIVFYCIIIFFLYKNKPVSKHISKVICVLVSAIIFLIGISRIYLGVHYFSDVAGGYLTGFIWLMALYLLTTRKW
ncbi:MAG: phosphatase PAP2 family protein, partial [Fibrobacter sp.]|nr:phosphatase PAP2 family protein [Fibrobacter sp.]